MRLDEDMDNIYDEITKLLDNEIPINRDSLRNNVINLEKVAQYCEDLYIGSKETDKLHLLNETKGYATQSLASISYQINTLASHFLNVLEFQSTLIDDMGFKLNELTHEVNIHNEKVARREIGVLTTNKNILRNVKVKKPDSEEKPVKYIRKPIDYSQLDDIGHGVRINKQEFKIGRQNSYSSTHSSGSDIRGAPTMKPPTPPLTLKSSANTSLNSVNNSGGTIRSQASYYRTPVVPPSVPSEYLSRQELGIYSSKKELNFDSSYGGPTGYRRPSQTSGDYSGMDTLDKRLANTYIQQLSSMSTNSVGYATGNGLLRTNLNNIDYATNGTIYRRPQLQNTNIYSRSSSLQTNETPTSARVSQLKQDGTKRSNSVTNDHHSLPPPPEFFDEKQKSFNTYDEELYVTGGGSIDGDDNRIPHWVPLDRVIEKVVSTYDYQGVRADELSFRENQVIYVLKKNDDNWYEGIMQREDGEIITGLYPFNYARIIKTYLFTENSRSSEC
jgi:abl interactor 2